MKWVLAFVAVLATTPATRAGEADLFNLDELLSKATALTTLPGGAVLVATPSGGYLCIIRYENGYFGQIANGVDPSPGWIPTYACVSTAHAFQMEY